MIKACLACLAAAGALLSGSVHAQPVRQAARVVDAAQGFLATLTPAQRRLVVFAFDDQAQRARWSNFPTGFVPRGGIDFAQMNDVQRAAATRLLATVLSPMGLEKVDAIRQADDDFRVNGSRRGPPGGGGSPPQKGTGPGPGPRPGPGGAGRPVGPPPAVTREMFGRDLYYFSFVGEPSATRPWMLQFGGHHLALNITIVGDRNVLTPTLTGAQPARFTLDGKGVRPLARESDEALALLRSLDDSQQKQAILDYAVPDLVLGPGEDGKTIVPDGLKASRMNAVQRALLMKIVAEWAGIVNDEAATARIAQLTAELDDTWFAWSGPTATKPGDNITAYYRIQGPHLVIEYAPQQDEPDNHVHTIYRDPTDDYGRSTIER